MSYVDPILKHYTDLPDLFESKDSFFLDSKDTRSIRNILQNQRVLLVSEPGFGKTRLLKERLLIDGVEGIFIDIKKISGQSIADYINDVLDELQSFESYNDELGRVKLFKTKNFKLVNSSKIVVCFDALDEMNQSGFENMIGMLRVFLKKYSKVKIIVSCRKAHLRRWNSLFSDVDFDYYELLPLDRDKVREFLKASGLGDEGIDALFNKLRFQYRDYLIQTPRYLELVADKAQTNVDELENITRGQLLELFIYKKLDLERINAGSEAIRIDIVKRVLEKLALLMEMYQTNEIKKDELMDFFDDIKSTLNEVLLNQMTLDEFIDRTVLKENIDKDNIDTVEFENAEFQEYLASKEMLRLGNVSQIVFDLTVVKDLDEIHPSWLNTLSFLVEHDQSILRQVLDYVNGHSIPLEDYMKLLTRFGVDKLPESERRAIFSLVFDYYQCAGHWLSLDVVENLAFYYDKTLALKLRKVIRSRSLKGDVRSVAVANVIALVGDLVDRQMLMPSELNYWKGYIRRILFVRGQHEVVMRRGILALAKFGDANIFTSRLVNRVFSTGEDTIISDLFYAIEELNLESPLAIQTVIRGVKKDNLTARHHLYKLKTNEGIALLLKHLASDNALLYELLNHESIFFDDHRRLIANIERADVNFIPILKRLVKNALNDRTFFRAEKSKLIRAIAVHIDKKTDGYLFDLIRLAELHSLFSLSDIFADIIRKDQVRRFVANLRELTGSNSVAIHVFQIVKQSERIDADEIYEEGRQFIPDEYELIESPPNRDKEAEDRLRIYNEFLMLLQPSDGKYVPSVFSFYVDHAKELDGLITPENIARLKYLISDSIFDKFDPGQHQLHIERVNDSSTRYTTHSWIHIFGDCLFAARSLNMNVGNYRQRILNYIPFAYHNHTEAIFALIPNPTTPELQNVLRLFEDRTDDLKVHRPSSMISFCKKYRITSGLSLLKYFIESDLIQVHDKLDALEAIALLDRDKREKSYFQHLFDELENPDDTSLIDKINEVLVGYYNDRDAIEWRFQQLIERAFPFKRPKGVHGVSSEEHELDRREFANALVQLKLLSLKPRFLKLLNDSMSIMSKGPDFFDYTGYIWSVVMDYFRGLKELGDLSILNDLELAVGKLLGRPGGNWLRYHYQRLKLEYIVDLGKPKNFFECIKKYNELKTCKYLDISSDCQLFEYLKKAFERDLQVWWGPEGGKDYVFKYGKPGQSRREDEDLIQKLLKPQIELLLMRAGLRSTGINILREVQLLNDKRTDFLVYHGFIGPVLIEVKLFKNPEARPSTALGNGYKAKLLDYMRGTGSNFGIFLVFEVDNNFTKKDYIKDLEDYYGDEVSLAVIGL